MPNANLALDGLAPTTRAPADAASKARLRAMVDAHSDFVWVSVRRFGVPDVEADDVVQRVFVQASERLDEIPAGRERAYLYRIALGITANVKRSLQRRREIGLETPDLDEPVDPAPYPDDVADARRARALADAILATMPLELRSVFVLFEVDEMSMADIASLLGVPRGTVASRLRRAREDFQERLKRWQARRPTPGAKR